MLYDQFFRFLLLKQTQKRYPEVYRDFLEGYKGYVRGLRHFDEVITAPYGGFSDRHDYYWRCSPKRWVSKITKPTIVLSAADDPLVPEKSTRSAPYSRSTELLLTSSGGHLGFIASHKNQRGIVRWLEETMPKIIAYILEVESS